MTDMPQEPQLLRLLGVRTIWIPDLDADLILLGDDKLCLIRSGLDGDTLDAALDDAWDDYWEQARDEIIDRLIAACLTTPEPSRVPPDASGEPR